MRKLWALIGAMSTVGVGCSTSVHPAVAPSPEAPLDALDELLRSAVTREGYVDYDYLEAHREPLDAYVAWLSLRSSERTSQTTSKRARHAQALNTYNVLVLVSVLDLGRPSSVMDVPGWFPVDGSGFFIERRFSISGAWLNLWDMEHERVRLRYLDERDHAALNCASRSCPPLRPEVYRTQSLPQQLQDQMRVWVEDSERGVRIEEGVAVFSPIFDWFSRDFDLWTGGVDRCTLAARYATDPLRSELRALAEAGCPHRFGAYDWSLNHQSMTEEQRRLEVARRLTAERVHWRARPGSDEKAD